MEHSQINSDEARRRWRDLLDDAQKGAVAEIVRNGKPVAILMPVDEVAKLRNACQLLGRVVTEQARAMEAARIQMLQVGAEEAMEWILQSLPDVDDNDPEDQWNGSETAQEWFDRTREAPGRTP